MARDDADASTFGAEPRRRDRDRSALRRRAFRTLVVALVIGTLVGIAAPGSAGAASTIGSGSTMAEGTASTGGASSGAEPAVIVSDATVEPESTTGHRVSLTDVPAGLAGFKLTLAVDDGDVATVTNASYPGHFGLTTDPNVSADGETITVEAADLGDEVAAGATDVTLATIDVTGVADGRTDLRVTEVQIDADDGSAIDPSIETGTLTVDGDATETAPETGERESDPNGSGSDGSDSESGGSGSEPEGNDTPSDDENDSSSDDAESLPGFAVGPALVAIAVLAVAALAQLR